MCKSPLGTLAFAGASHLIHIHLHSVEKQSDTARHALFDLWKAHGENLAHGCFAGRSWALRSPGQGGRERPGYTLSAVARSDLFFAEIP
jgi:hypothetical protein